MGGSQPDAGLQTLPIVTRAQGPGQWEFFLAGAYLSLRRRDGLSQRRRERGDGLFRKCTQLAGVVLIRGGVA